MPTRLVVLVLAPCAGLTTTLLSRSPLVITADDLLPPATVCDLRRTLTEEADLAPTGDYQEDVFAADAEEIEDARLRAIVQRAGVEATVPDASALEAFLGAYTTDPSRFASDDVLAAAAMIKRREAKAAWDSEAGRRLLALNPGFETAARRRAMPDAERGALARTVVPRVLSDRARWTVEDATVVRYAAGESQVLHVDPSDATLLLYLSDEGIDCGGGGTLFLLGDGIRVARGARARRALLLRALRPCRRRSRAGDRSAGAALRRAGRPRRRPWRADARGGSEAPAGVRARGAQRATGRSARRRVGRVFTPPDLRWFRWSPTGAAPFSAGRPRHSPGSRARSARGSRSVRAR